MKWQNSAASRLRQRQNRTFATRASAAAGSSAAAAAAAAAVAAFGGGGTGGGRGGGGGRKRKATRRRGESNRVESDNTAAANPDRLHRSHPVIYGVIMVTSLCVLCFSSRIV